MPVQALKCKECDSTYPLDARYVCEQCFGPLEVAYDHSALDAAEAKRKIQSGPQTLWRYADFLPFAAPPQAGLPVGLTPLQRAPRLAEALGVEPEPFEGEPRPLEQQMADAGEIWPEVVRRHGLRDFSVDTLASWWHTDADLGRTIATFTDMGHSRRLGFQGVRDSESSFTDLFARLKAERIVP